MKKLLTVFLALAFMVGTIGCGKAKEPTKPGGTKPAAGASDTAPKAGETTPKAGETTPKAP